MDNFNFTDDPSNWSSTDLSGYPKAATPQLEARLAYVLVELQASIYAEAQSYATAQEAAINAYYSSPASTIKDREWEAKHAAGVYNSESTYHKAAIACWQIERDFITLLLANRN